MIQRNVRKHLFLRDWKWWKLYTKVKPLLNVARTEDELRQKEEELNKMREKVSKEEQGRKALEDIKTQLMEEKNQLFVQLQRVCGVCVWCAYLVLAFLCNVPMWLMYVYVCVYMCMYVHVCVCMCMCVHVCGCVWEDMTAHTCYGYPGA